MKVSWNNKYTTIAVYSLIVICSSILLYIGISRIDLITGKINGLISTLRPFLIGGALAYILNFILDFYEKKILTHKGFEKLSRKGKRGIGIFLTYVSAIIMVYLFMQFVLPQLIDSIVGLANNIPQYVNEASEFADKVITGLDIEQQYLDLIMSQWNDFVNFVIKFITDMVPVLGNYLVALTSSILNILIGVIISIYILIDKEKFLALSRKITYSMLPANKAKKTLELAKRSNYTFGRFVSGKLLDSFIIGVLTFIILTIFNMPYTLLISVIIGVTNIIPFFGPFFGAIPSAIIIVFVSPIQALWFIGIILVIQQIDGNIIGPKILGDSIGISAFWILFSLLIFSKLLGFVGMIIGVPIFAVVYSIIKDIVEENLKKKGLPTDTIEYE